MGRSPFARFFPTGVVFIITTGYYGYHSAGTGLLKEFYGYYDANGKRDTLSEDLRKMIGEVYLEAREKEKLTREYFESKLSKPGSITWFASSTLEPLAAGMTEFRTGATIGLPYFYNYKSYDDVPDSALEVKKLKLFRNPFKRSEKKQSDEKDSDKELVAAVTGNQRVDGPKFEVIKKFDRNSDLGREFMDTLILSDDAKRFSIARELFIVDSYRVVVNNFVILLSGIAAITAARVSVSYFKVLKSPVAVRIPYYLLSAVYGFGLYKIAVNESDRSYLTRARDRAKNMGENYVKGADEYFEKCKRRRELLIFRDSKDEDY